MSNYLDPYREGIKHFGTDFEVTLWASPRTQTLRFEIFSELYKLNDVRILDAGCSRGDLAQWLLDHNIHYGKYIGVDGIEEVIDYAKTRQLPRSEFVAGDFVANPVLLKTGDPQVICISGSLNTMSDDEAMRVLNNAWDATSDVLMFNFLSDMAGPDAPLQDIVARRLNTLNLIGWALGKTDNVIFRQDYFPSGHDATIRMVR